MKNAKRDWTDELPGMLEAYTEPEPDGLWEAVRAAAVPRRRKTAAWWYAGGAFAAAAAVAALVLLTRPAAPVPPAVPSPGDRLAEQMSPVTEEAGPALAAVPSVETVPERPGSQTSRPSSRHERTASPEASAPETPGALTPPAGPSESAPVPDSTQDSSQASGQEASQSDPSSHTPADADAPSRNPSDSRPATRVPLHNARSRRATPVREAARIQLGVTTNLLAQASTQSLSGSPALLAQASSPALPGSADAFVTRSMYSGGNVWDVMMAGRNKPVTAEVSHRQSARFGASLKLGLLPRWGLETGLVGTQLQSTFRSPAGNAVVTTEHAFTYWGVPLYLHFDAFQWRSLDLYLAAGPMLEWTRSRKENQYLDLNGKRMASRSATTPLHDTRVSLNLGAGLQWTFFEHNALFVQPGFSWHLPSEGAPSNFYSAHPAAFQLTLGYRLLLF